MPLGWALLSRELKRENMWARIHLVPLLMAEGDRDAYRREQAARAREKEIMKDVRGWEVRAILFTALLFWNGIWGADNAGSVVCGHMRWGVWPAACMWMAAVAGGSCGACQGMEIGPMTYWRGTVSESKWDAVWRHSCRRKRRLELAERGPRCELTHDWMGSTISDSWRWSRSADHGGLGPCIGGRGLGVWVW